MKRPRRLKLRHMSGGTVTWYRKGKRKRVRAKDMP